MKSFSKVMLFALLILITVPAVAQKTAKPSAKGAANPLLKAVGELELTPEQKTKIDAAAKEFNDSMTALRKEGLTQALNKKQADAMKAARDAGKKGPTLADDVLASLDITDEQKGLLKKARDIQAKMQKSLAAALTETQIAGLPQGAKTTLKRAASEGKKTKK
jgi:hypothetical protein